MANSPVDEAYCWLIYFSHHEDGSLRCEQGSCAHCAARLAAEQLWSSFLSGVAANG